MILLFTVILLVSIAGMSSLLVLKRWELVTGRVVAPALRPAAGAMAHRALVWLEHDLPQLSAHWSAVGRVFVQNFFHRLSALVVVLVERGLERLLRALRRTTAVPRSDSSASEFLREVSAHKAELLRGSRNRGAIYEE